MKTKQEFIATATHSQTHGRIEFTGTEALTELLGRFGSGRLVHLCAADTLERLTADYQSSMNHQNALIKQMTADRKQYLDMRDERDALKADAERYRWMKKEVKRIPPGWEMVGWDAAIDAAIQGVKK